MRRFFTLLTAAALLATPAMAEARGFDSDFSQTITGPLKLEVLVSDDLAHRANNLPKKRSARTSRRLNAAFANNGMYGDKEITFLVDDLNDELTRDFSKRGISLSDTASTVLRVTIIDARNNRPTFNQLGEDPSLSFQSFGVGGTEISAQIIRSSGEVIGEAEYDYYASFNDYPFKPIGTWTDTRLAFSRFSKTLSKKLAKAGAASGS